MDSFHIWYKWSIAWKGVSHVMTFDLDLYLQGHSDLTWNRVRSVSSAVLVDSFYMWHIWSLLLKGVSGVKFFQNLEIWIFGKFFKFFGLDFEKKSTVLDGFFLYLAQMITRMRGCVAYNDLWPWPISSRSFGLGLENRVRSAASTVLDGFFSIFGTNEQ